MVTLSRKELPDILEKLMGIFTDIRSYSFVMMYIPGKKNHMSDTISRAPI